MFLNANAYIFEQAKMLRQNMTAAECMLWEYLKHKPGGFKFRRQHPIGNFIADFYCNAKKLVIEVDGKIHEREEIKERDQSKEQFLAQAGIKVIRITNEEVENEFDKTVEKINLLLTN